MSNVIFIINKAVVRHLRYSGLGVISLEVSILILAKVEVIIPFLLPSVT